MTPCSMHSHYYVVYTYSDVVYDLIENSPGTRSADLAMMVVHTVWERARNHSESVLDNMNDIKHMAAHAITLCKPC